MARYTQLSKPRPTMETLDILAFARGDEVPPGDVDTDRKTRGQQAPAGYKRLTINVPEDIHRMLRMRSVQDSTTATEIIMRLLKKELGV